MQIKPSVYQNLTAQQRLVAVIEAFARKDVAEVDRLMDSCPKRTYRLNDWEFSRGLQKLMYMAKFVECMLLRQVSVFMLGLFLDKDEMMDSMLQSIADTQAAWDEALSTIGIRPETAQKAAGAEPLILELMAELIPEPEPEAVAKLAAEFKGCIH